MHLLQKIQTVADASERKTMHLREKTSEQNEDVNIFLVLPKYHIFFI